MDHNIQTIALIVAAGRGRRARMSHDETAKQYRNLGGTSILDRTVLAFAQHRDIDMVQVIIRPDDHHHYLSSLCNAHEKLADPVEGGDTRQASVLAGLQAISKYEPSNVLIHDAVRPFVTEDLIKRVLDGLKEYQCVLPALRVTDTLKKVADEFLSGPLDRRGVWRAQTPQGFKFSDVLQAHQAAMAQNLNDFTDDSAIAEWYGLKVRVVEGSSFNMKLTTPEDFQLAEAHVTMETQGVPSPSSSQVRVGNGYDVHRFGDGNHVVLCGVSIPHTRSLAGHSDADVGLHALTDAIFGALCDGDIGSHFPPSDPQWKGADSAHFLAYAGSRVASRGGAIIHLDVTLICETPKIGPHREEMRKAIATILNLSLDRVSVKATTTEKLGFTGREEGIAAMATASISIA